MFYRPAKFGCELNFITVKLSIENITMRFKDVFYFFAWQTLAWSECTQPQTYWASSDFPMRNPRKAAKKTLFFFGKRRSTINLSHPLSLVMKTESLSLKFALGFFRLPVYIVHINKTMLRVFIQCRTLWLWGSSCSFFKGILSIQGVS